MADQHSTLGARAAGAQRPWGPSQQGFVFPAPPHPCPRARLGPSASPSLPPVGWESQARLGCQVWEARASEGAHPQPGHDITHGSWHSRRGTGTLVLAPFHPAETGLRAGNPGGWEHTGHTLYTWLVCVQWPSPHASSWGTGPGSPSAIQKGLRGTHWHRLTQRVTQASVSLSCLSQALMRGSQKMTMKQPGRMRRGPQHPCLPWSPEAAGAGDLCDSRGPSCLVTSTFTPGPAQWPFCTSI